MAKGIGGGIGKGMGGGMKSHGFSKPAGSGGGFKHSTPKPPRPGGLKMPEMTKAPRPGGPKGGDGADKQAGMQGGPKDVQETRYGQTQGTTRRASCIGCALPALILASLPLIAFLSST